MIEITDEIYEQYCVGCPDEKYCHEMCTACEAVEIAVLREAHGE